MNEVIALEKRQNSSADQLVEATARLLSGRTSIELTFAEITKRSGLNSALIKYYFGNKEGLLLALLKRDAKQAMNALEKLVEMPISAEQKLRIHISGIINAYHRSPYLNRLIHYMIETGSADAVQEVVHIFIEPMLAAYRAIVAQGVKEGTFRDVDAGLLYYSLVGACDHLFFAAYSVKAALGIPTVDDELKQRYIAHVTKTCLVGILAADAD